MNVLVTGGGGFIGRHLVESLRRDGHAVTVFDTATNGADDVRVADAVFQAVRGRDVVFHLAAECDPAGSIGADAVNWDVNLGGTVNLLRALETCRARLVFASSVSVYGNAPRHVAREDTPLRPQTVYAASKASAEMAIEAYVRAHDLDATILRFGRVVGVGQPRGVIHDFIAKLRENPNRLAVLGDGRQSQPYLHVSDCVQAMQAVLARRKHGVERFNVANTDACTVNDIANIVATTMGLATVEKTYSAGWRGDVTQLLVDTGRLQRCGWFPALRSREAVTWAARDMAK